MTLRGLVLSVVVMCACAPEMETGPRTVEFKVTRLHVTDRDVTPRECVSSSDAGVTLTLADGTELNGVRDGERFFIADVPRGPYVVRYGNGFYVGSTDTLDVGSVVWGRRDLSWSQYPWSLSFNASEFEQWEQGDQFQLYAPGAQFFSRLDSLSDPVLVADRATSHNVTFSTYEPGPIGMSQLIDGSKGDIATVMQRRAQTLVVDEFLDTSGQPYRSEYTCDRVVSVARTLDVTMSEGVSLSGIPLIFDGTAKRDVRVQIPRNEWASLASQVHPLAEFSSENFAVTAHSRPSASGVDFITCYQAPRSMPLVDIDTVVTAVNPWPQWRTYAEIRNFYRVDATLKNGQSVPLYGLITSTSTPGELTAPRVRPPRNLRINGAPASELSTIATDTPLAVTWERGELGPAPSRYTVELVWPDRYQEFVITFAVTPETRFTFPAGFLQRGAPYFVRVRAIEADAPEQQPWKGFTASTAATFSDVFIAE